MEEFLLTREPFDIVRISTALFVRVEEGEWIGILEKEVFQYGIITSEDADYDVGRCITESTSYKKTMWERIEMELEEINVENLGFDHPICSGILDIKSEPFTNIPGSVSDIFKESFRRYKLE
ncbi:398_t:CDS:2 [Funneliformis geosporum]|nr:398_t:CDS:2 [Funneliformis geosporum]